MKLNIAFLIVFYSFLQISVAQTVIVAGVVKDAKSDQPVPFATLGIKGKNIGSVADENGAFHFEIEANQFSSAVPLLVSSIGYEQTSIPLDKFKQGKQVITLNPSADLLKTVTIKPGKFKTKVFGRTGSSTMMASNMFTEKSLVNDNLGKEQATILSIDKHCFIKDFNMLVTFNRFDSVKFRLNFYSVKDGLPDQLIVNPDILFDVTQKSGWVNVDLTKYNIYLDGYKEVAVAIQWVKSVKLDTTTQSSFGVSVVPVPFRAMFFRNKSQAAWEKQSPAYVAFNITANTYKLDKEKESIQQPEEKPLLNDTMKTYLAYAKYAREAAASGYGNSKKAGKYIQLPDADIYYEIYGSGAPLLLLHGNNGDISSFYKQIPELAKSYQVIAVDTRGQGKSTDKTTAPLTYEKFAEDMKLLLDALHIKKTAILGWSDGGNTGLIMTVKYPAMVNKLVTMGAVLSPEGVERSVLEKLQASSNANETSNRNDKIPQNQANNNNQRLLALLLNEPHITDSELNQIQVPVLVIAGEKDVVKTEHTREIAEHIKQGRLQIIKDATHDAPKEKPLEFNGIVLEFLKRS